MELGSFETQTKTSDRTIPEQDFNGIGGSLQRSLQILVWDVMGA